MANTKITSLPLSTSPSTDAVIYVVDNISGTMTDRKAYFPNPNDLQSGATLPASPTANQFFVHTPTGRRALMLYTGGAWYPVQSFGTMTIYVDGALGTDNANNGFGAGASAYKTLSYMWTQIPAVYFGNVTVNVAAGTYAETLICQGKAAGGAYTITITGATTTIESGTSSSGVAGTGATAGSLTDTSKSWAIDAYKGDFVTVKDMSRVIVSNTANTLTIAGTFSVAPSGAYSVTHPSVIIDGVGNGVSLIGQDVNFTNISFSGASNNQVSLTAKSRATLTTCTVTGATANDLIYVSGSEVTIKYCAISSASTGYGLRITSLGKFADMTGTALLKTGAGAAVAINVTQASAAYSSGGIVIDGFASGIVVDVVSQYYMGGPAEAGYNVIRNCTTGLNALKGGQIVNTANNQYSGNTTNESAVAASYGYID